MNINFRFLRFHAVTCFLMLAAWPTAACKVTVNFDWSKKQIEHLLNVAAQTGTYDRHQISKIESRSPGRGTGWEMIIDLKSSTNCKRLVFQASQPNCSVEYKFLKEEACSAK